MPNPEKIEENLLSTPKEKEQQEQLEASKQEVAEIKQEVEEKKEKPELKNETYFAISKGVWFGKGGAGASGVSESQKDRYATTRAELAGSFFKGGVLQTDMYSFMDMDGNLLKSVPFGMVQLSKQVYKGLNIEGVYTFTGKGKNAMKYGISYAGALPEGWYKIKLLPLNHEGKPLGTSFDISLFGTTKVGKNGTVNSFLNIDGLNNLPATFYGETKYVHDLAKNLAVFAQARYGKFTQEAQAFLSGGVGIRLNIH